MKLLLKNIKIIPILFLAISFLGCEDDDEGTSLPEVIAKFTQTVVPNSGTVSFINISENANSYEWDFGDGTTSTEINPTKTYTSGTYTVTLSASNVAGASSVFEDELTITIPDPIMVPITFDDANVDYSDIGTFTGAAFEIVANPAPGGSNDQASQVGAITNSGAQFEGIFFNLGTAIDLTANKTIQMNFWSEAAIDVLVKLEEGTGADTEIAASHGGTGWEMISFDFTSSDSFSRITLFVDGPGTTSGTFYLDDIVQIETPPVVCTDTMLELPMDFDCEGITYDFVTFNGASYSVVDNPQLSGVNSEASKVGEIVNVGGAFEGGAFTLDTPVDFSTDKSITMKVYSTVALPVLLKFEGAGAPIETPVNHGGTGWEQLTFDFTSSDQFTTLVLFIDGPGTTAGTFYIDDIEQVPTGGGTVCTDTMLELPMDFDCEGITYDFVTFNGASYSVVDNPQLSGVNSEVSKVGEIVNVGGAFEGGAFTLDTPVDFATDKSITMKVYSTVALPVLLKFEGAGAPIETPVNHGGTGWEQLTFDFTSSDQFTTLVLFIDGPGTTAGTFYIDDIEQVPTGSGTVCTDTMLELPIDFDCESLTYDFVTFNGASYSVIDNPQLSGVNSMASKVGEIVNAGGAFEGGAFTLDTPVDFSTDKSITMKVYSTVALPVLLKFEGAVAPIETPVNHGGTGWEQLTFDFTSSDQFTTLVLFIDGPGTTAGTFYIDDIEQVATSGGGGGGGTSGELATNGDFETGDDTGWFIFQNAGTAALDNTTSNGGTWSGKLTVGDSGGNPAFKQERIGAGTVAAGDVVQIQFDHIGTVVQPGAAVNVILFGEGASGASFTQVLNPGPTLGTSWTTYTGSFEIPGGTDVSEGISFLIETVCGAVSGCSVTMNIDNVSVTLNP
nr:carbohydrate binding domain-containing protein [uncultured Allomuricauda sp.]